MSPASAPLTAVRTTLASPRCALDILLGDSEAGRIHHDSSSETYSVCFPEQRPQRRVLSTRLFIMTKETHLGPMNFWLQLNLVGTATITLAPMKFFHLLCRVCEVLWEHETRYAALSLGQL